MELKTRPLGEWLAVSPGETRLDAYVADDFKKELASIIARGSQSIIIDLSAVELMDSSGLGSLVFCRQRLGEDGQLVLASLKPEVRNILALTRLDRVFQIVDAPEDVLEKVT